jgi:aqualysin 1
MCRRKTGFPVLAILVTLLLMSAPLPAQQPGNPKFRPRQDSVLDQWIVVLAPQAAGSRGSASRARAVASEVAGLYGGTVRFVYDHVLNGFALQAPPGVAEAVSLDPRVASVTQDTVMTAFDTQFNPPSWGLDRVDQHSQPLNSAYSYHVTGAGVHAYIIDSGIRTTHAEFGGRASAAADFVGDGQNGNDCYGHGTHVAGTVGGNSVGVAKGVSLHAVRVFDCLGRTTSGAVIAGVNWVTGNRLNPAVVNMSLGGPAFDDLDNAIRQSIASGVVYVISAGNDDVDANTVSPARVVEAITVGATDSTDRRATWDSRGRSNYGSVLDVFAPGKSIFSAWIGSDTTHATLEGTSMAAPHVAGAAAMYLQTTPGASPANVAAALTSSATSGVIQDPGAGSPNRLLYSAWIGAPPPTDGPDILSPGETLYPNQSVISGDGRFELKYQGDGNLVLYRVRDGAPLWAINCWPTCRNIGGAGVAIMQTDGNFVVYNSAGAAVWASGTGGNPGAFLRVQSDGNVVVYSGSGRALWSTGTCCQFQAIPTRTGRSSE